MLLVPPEFVDGAASIGHFQDRGYLRFGELRFADGNVLARVAIMPEDLPYDCLELRVACKRSASLRSNHLSDVAARVRYSMKRVSKTIQAYLIRYLGIKLNT